jgi:hypothetical protein
MTTISSNHHSHYSPIMVNGTEYSLRKGINNSISGWWCVSPHGSEYNRWKKLHSDPSHRTPYNGMWKALIPGGGGSMITGFQHIDKIRAALRVKEWCIENNYRY